MPDPLILACVVLTVLVVVLAVLTAVNMLKNKRLSRTLKLRQKELEKVQGRIVMLQNSLRRLQRGGEEEIPLETPATSSPEPEQVIPAESHDVPAEKQEVTEEKPDAPEKKPDAPEEKPDAPEIKHYTPDQVPRSRKGRSGKPAHVKAAEDMDLFGRMDRMIRDEKLYLDSDLHREDLMSRLGIGKDRMGRILGEAGVTGSFTSYINAIRLEHSRALMLEHPEYRIDKIAIESGFGNVRNLQRILKAAYGMTPAGFRRDICGQNSTAPTKTA